MKDVPNWEEVLKLKAMHAIHPQEKFYFARAGWHHKHARLRMISSRASKFSWKEDITEQGGLSIPCQL
jgi:hypothetical protein